MPVAHGINREGKRVVLHLSLGVRKSTASWKGVLNDLVERGLKPPQLFITDGNQGLLKAMNDIWPEVPRQRCVIHRIRNVLARVPKKRQAEARRWLREMAETESQKACEELRDRYVAELLAADQRAAADTILRDWEDFVTFYHYPKEHWVHLRTTNPLESIFSGVKIRTDAAKRMRRRDNALYLVFKIVERLSRNWRALNGGVNLMALVLEGETFKDGIRQRRNIPEKVPVMV